MASAASRRTIQWCALPDSSRSSFARRLAPRSFFIPRIGRTRARASSAHSSSGAHDRGGAERNVQVNGLRGGVVGEAAEHDDGGGSHRS